MARQCVPRETVRLNAQSPLSVRSVMRLMNVVLLLVVLIMISWRDGTKPGGMRE